MVAKLPDATIFSLYEALPPLPDSTKILDTETGECLADWSNPSEGKAELHLHTTDPFKRGHAQARIFGSLILAIHNIQLKIMQEMHHLDLSSESLDDSIKNVMIHEVYRNELKGIAFGLHEFFPSESGDPEKLVNSLAAVHQFINMQDVTDHPLTNFFFKRIHDVGSQNSHSPNRLEMETYPGYIGVITAENDRGISLEVRNSASSDKPEGVPASLHARKVLEDCESLEYIYWNFFGVDQRIYKPSNAHTLIASDGNERHTYSFKDDGSFSCKEETI